MIAKDKSPKFIKVLPTKHHVKIKFLLVGIWNTIFGFLVFVFLDTVFSRFFSARYIAYMSAMGAGNIAAIVNAYISHKCITFKSEVKGRRMLREFFRFSTIYIVTFCLSLILLPIFVEAIHFTPKISGAIVILICTVISYLGHSRYSFKAQYD